jgi:phosphoribosylanthranilate isomerase
LWIAGGIGPDNVAEVMRSFAPELIDASSRLEEESGRKDRAKLETFFKEIERHADVQ